jgi:uncharacterized protein (DUF486 family)
MLRVMARVSFQRIGRNGRTSRGRWRRQAHADDKPPMTAAILLLISNIFMTFAWYGHLKFKGAPMWLAILASWGIALFEYCFQVPANRIGHQQFTATQLKIMQEAITLVVFIVFAKLYFAGEPIRWNYLVGMALIFLAVFVVFYEWS